jgi:EF hand domain-containing protein
MKPLLLLAAFCICLPAAAGDPGAWFRKLDRNRDGYLDRKELSGMRRHLAVFEEADENRDGKLDADEFIRAEVLVQEMKRGARRPSPATAEPARKEPAPG